MNDDIIDERKPNQEEESENDDDLVEEREIQKIAKEHIKLRKR